LDHKWGRLVDDLGLGNSGCNLASHFVGFPGLIITNEKVPFTDQCRVWVVDPDEDIPFSPSYLGIVGFHPRFPYGFNVVPDEPV